MTKNVFDIGLDEMHDFAIEYGDFKIIESTEQNIEQIMLSDKGNWKNSPLTGVGLRTWLNNEGDTTLLEQEIKQQLEIIEGMIIRTLEIQVDGVNVKAEYKG